jgi:choline kinase
VRGVILAAGQGTRLDGGDVKPKCLFKVGGVTLLARQIESLKAAQVNDICVVIGFQGDLIRRQCPAGINFVENSMFAETSSLYSLWLARDYLADGFVVLNSDVLFHYKILETLLHSSHHDALLVAYNNGTTNFLGEEEMKVKVKNGVVIDISKEINPQEADGENVGIVKFGSTGAKLLIEYMNDLIERGGLRDWAPRAFKEFALHHSLHAISTNNYPWIEIDFSADYDKAVNETYPLIRNWDNVR